VGQLAWGAATKIDGGYSRLEWQQPRFPAKRFNIALAERQRRGGIETTIDASGSAKRNMDVKTRIGRHFIQSMFVFYLFEHEITNFI